MPQRPAPASSRVAVLAAAALLSLFTFFVPAAPHVAQAQRPTVPAPSADWGRHTAGHPAAHAVLAAHAGRWVQQETAPHHHTGPLTAVENDRAPLAALGGPAAADAVAGHTGQDDAGTAEPRAPPHAPRTASLVISA
ncbi:hypothetical protein [Streptomyces sp. cg35]|uniref:hypothetical protein n=1 Tax=Streptomyces sp. cg35 TaxID=3421650 RepID=UPI003D17FCD4